MGRARPTPTEAPIRSRPTVAPFLFVTLAALAAAPAGAGRPRPPGSHEAAGFQIYTSPSVVDIEPTSASFLTVVDTIQSLDPTTRTTRFDEPVGIAFAEDGSKAFVALSSRNQIAMIDATTRAVTLLPVNGQEPRALAVRNGRDTIADARVQVALGTTLANGAHLLQIQNQAGLGLLSNEMPFCVGTAAQCN